MNRALHGSCHVPVAALARLQDGMLVLQALVGSAEDGRLVRAQAAAAVASAEALGRHVASELLDAGAAAFLPPQGAAQ